jgi:hypothetical protein
VKASAAEPAKPDAIFPLKSFLTFFAECFITVCPIET